MIKYKKVTIETDGTSMGTRVFVDGKQIGLVQKIEFLADVNDVFVKLNLQVGCCVNGELKKKQAKVRDNKTEKFIDKEIIETEPLMLERDVN